MDSPAIKKYQRIKAELPDLSGPKREKALQDLAVLEDIIRASHPLYVFDASPEQQDEALNLAKSIHALQARLKKADAWFADPANADHPRFEEFGRAAGRIAKELDAPLSRAYELGLYWDGKGFIPWADAFNPSAVAADKRPQSPMTLFDQLPARPPDTRQTPLFTTPSTPDTPPQPWSGVVVEDLSHLDMEDD